MNTWKKVSELKKKIYVEKYKTKEITADELEELEEDVDSFIQILVENFSTCDSPYINIEVREYWSSLRDTIWRPEKLYYSNEVATSYCTLFSKWYTRTERIKGEFKNLLQAKLFVSLAHVGIWYKYEYGCINSRQYDFKHMYVHFDII